MTFLIILFILTLLLLIAMIVAIKLEYFAIASVVFVFLFIIAMLGLIASLNTPKTTPCPEKIVVDDYPHHNLYVMEDDSYFISNGQELIALTPGECPPIDIFIQSSKSYSHEHDHYGPTE